MISDSRTRADSTTSICIFHLIKASIRDLLREIRNYQIMEKIYTRIIIVGQNFTNSGISKCLFFF